MKKLIIVLVIFLTGCYSNISITDINKAHTLCKNKETTLVTLTAYSGAGLNVTCSDGLREKV